MWTCTLMVHKGMLHTRASCRHNGFWPRSCTTGERSMSNSTAECSGVYTYLGSTHGSYVCTSPIHIPSDNIGS